MLDIIDHIGIAVPNMELWKEKYLKKGYKIIRESYDEYFLTQLCLLKKDDEVLELVYSDNENSKVFSFCQKGDEVIYHKCYRVKNIHDSIKKLRIKKFVLISEIVYSKLLFGKVCFLYSKEKGVIELLEVGF